MVLESLGVIKIASALKCAGLGIAAAIPPLLDHSAAATQQLVIITTPVVTKGGAMLGTGLVALGAVIAKGTAAAKASLAGVGGAHTATAKAATGIAKVLQPPLA